MNLPVVLIYLITFVVPGFSCFAQKAVVVDTLVSAESLIREEFLKGGIEIRNISYKGNRQALGLFTYRSDQFPLSSGIILSTGKAADIAGPNHSLKTSGVFHSTGDSVLNMISRGWTEDACVIEFDFIPSSENIAFDFVFGSEEYPEYVNSVFNDVFAFIVTNISTSEKFNIAHLPSTGEPVTVNNVNHLKNQEYFIDNPAPNILYLMEKEDEIAGKGSRKKQQEIQAYNQSLIKCRTKICEEIQYDGFTKVITARAKVTPDQTYHFKIGIGDVSDALYDSGVILRSHSFKSFDNYGRIKGDTTGELVVLPGVTEILPEDTPPKPVVRSKEVTQAVVLFDFDSALLTGESLRVLDSLAAALEKVPAARIAITGHTDGRGSYDYNDKLSKHRTMAVTNKLKSLGVDPKRISLDYKGEKVPATGNTSDEGRRLNRRVEIKVFQ